MARVWIFPQPLSSFSSEYVPISDRTNSFFEILEKKASGIFSFIPANDDYLLCMKNGVSVSKQRTDWTEQHWVVSVSMSRNSLEDNWAWIAEEILPTLSTNPAGMSLVSSSDILDKEAMFQFLEAKFTDLPSQFQQTKTNQRRHTEQQEFRTVFNLPTENLIASK